MTDAGKKFDRLVPYHRIHKRAVIATHIRFFNFKATTNEHEDQLLRGKNSLWPTQPKFWVAPAAPPCPQGHNHVVCW